MDFSLDFFDVFRTLDVTFLEPLFDKFETELVLFLFTAPLAFRYF